MIAQFTQIISTPLGALLVLALAAYFEIQGDACFQAGLYHSSGGKQIGWFISGEIVLVCYSLFLNSSKIDFGKLLGIYVVLFFLVAQIVAKLQFHQSPSKPIYVGGAFVVVGGLIMTRWKRSVTDWYRSVSRTHSGRLQPSLPETGLSTS